MIEDITTLDYILLPFYLWLIYKLAYHYRNKFYPEQHPFRSYFIPGLTAKIAGAVFIGLIYHYYYNGGDTFNFFFHTKIINSTLTSAPDTWYRLITHTADQNIYADSQAMSDMFWYDDIPSYTTACLGAIIGLFCFTKYLIINVIIAAISFIGMWLMFITFASQYKNITRYIAIAVLFMPGPVVWGSGLFKDSFCMFAAGCLIYSMHILFERKNFRASLLLLVSICIALLYLIKAYILVSLLPVLVLKAILFYKKTLDTSSKKIVFYFLVFLFAYIGYRSVNMATTYLANYNADKILESVKAQKDYLLRVSIEQEGAAYDLGDFEPTIPGILKMTFPAINVTLFRPYIWETKSVIQLFSALESACILLLTLYLLVKRNIFTTAKTIYKDPNLIACLIFSLIFAFIVGISSYNFGSLSRYKIPCTPFYVLFLIILIFNKNENADKKDLVTLEDQY